MQNTPEMTEIYKEQFCKGDYAWCGRYMAFKELERQQNMVKGTVAEGALS